MGDLAVVHLRVGNQPATTIARPVARGGVDAMTFNGWTQLVSVGETSPEYIFIDDDFPLVFDTPSSVWINAHCTNPHVHVDSGREMGLAVEIVTAGTAEVIRTAVVEEHLYYGNGAITSAQSLAWTGITSLPPGEYRLQFRTYHENIFWGSVVTATWEPDIYYHAFVTPSIDVEMMEIPE